MKAERPGLADAPSGTPAAATRSSCGSSIASVGSLRDLIDGVNALKARKVGFRSLQEAIDTTTSGGRLIFHVFASLAEFERDLVRERTHAGLAAARARGRLGGRRRVLDGTRLELARSLYADTKNAPRDIAKTLGVSLSTLYRYAGPSMVPPPVKVASRSKPSSAPKAKVKSRPATRRR